MSDYSVNVPVEYTTEDMDDATWGNGSLAQPWWTKVEHGKDDEPLVLVKGFFGCDGDTPKPFTVTFYGWLNAAQEVLRKHSHYAPYILDKDIDADLGDLILQYAVAKEAVYG